MLSDSSQPHSPRLHQCLTSTKTSHTRKKSSHTLAPSAEELMSLYPSLSFTHRHTHTHTYTPGLFKVSFCVHFLFVTSSDKGDHWVSFPCAVAFLWKSSSSCEKQTNDSHRADTWSTGTKGSYFLWIGTVAFRFSDWLTFLDRKKISHSEGELLCCGNPPFRLSGRFLVNDHFRLYFMQLGENSNAPCEEETHKTAGRKCENVCENVKSDYGLVAKWLVRLISRGSVGFYWACAALQSLTAKSCVIEQVTFLTLGLH